MDLIRGFFFVVDEVFDLFGDPVAANHGRRGRPQHVPTRENCNKVTMLLALGWSNDRIANALHVTLPTLRKHYFSVLKFRDVQRDRLTAALAMRLWSQVEAGNVSAMKEFQALIERNDRMLAERFYETQADEPAAPATARPGKKQLDEQRAMDADAELTAELEREAAAEAAAQNAVH